RSPERYLLHQDLFSTLQVAQAYRRATDSIPPDTLGMILLAQVPSRQSEQDLTGRVNSPPPTPELLVVSRRRPPPSEAAPCSQQCSVAPDLLHRNRSELRLAHTPRLASFVRSGC